MTLSKQFIFYSGQTEYCGYKLNETCYALTETMSWYEASTYCNTNFTGGHLGNGMIPMVVFERLILSLMNVSHVWIGTTKRPWKWGVGMKLYILTSFALPIIAVIAV